MLLPAAVVVYWASPAAIAVLAPLYPEAPVVMSALAVALTALAVSLVWAVLLMPLRARSELTPLGGELAAMKARGGFVEALRQERQQLEAWRHDASTRRRYHGRMALGGLFVSCLGALVTFILWAEGELWVNVAVFTAVAPLVTLYYAIRYLAPAKGP